MLPSSNYQTWPSAFQLIEWPLHVLNEVANRKDRITEINRVVGTPGRARPAVGCDVVIEMTKEFLSENWQDGEYRRAFHNTVFLAKRLLEKHLPSSPRVLAAIIHLTSIPINPIVVGLTPITLVADPLLGVVEALWAKVRYGATLDQIKNILRKKCIASPVQHLTFLSINAMGSITVLGVVGKFYSPYLPPTHVVLKAAAIGLLIQSIFAVFVYRFTQLIVGQELPSWARPHNFNIFIGSGASSFMGTKFTAKIEKEYSGYQATGTPWENFVQTSRQELKSLPAVLLLPQDHKLKPLITRLQSNCSPQGLLEVGESPSKEELERAYKKQAMVVHPDRNKDNVEIATILFKAISEARNVLENKR